MSHRNGRATVITLGLFAALCAAGPVGSADNIDPASDGHQFAWGENIGWLNAEPTADGGPGIAVGDFSLTGWLWGENVGWISLSCANTLSCGSNPYGVSNDGFGTLSGFGWGENIGWVNFDPSTCEPDATCGVSIDPGSGYFGGRAWGENVGWISFSGGAPQSWTARTDWCQTTAAPPSIGSLLSLSEAGPDVLLEWTGLSEASWYDVITGPVSVLRSPLGGFPAATEACEASRLAVTSHLHTGSSPALGDARWFLVRGTNCRGHGSYESGGGAQFPGRDAGISASSNDCP